jgi:hypothetical protein
LHVIEFLPASFLFNLQSDVIPSGKVREILKLNSFLMVFDKIPSIVKVPSLPHDLAIIPVVVKVDGILSAD